MMSEKYLKINNGHSEVFLRTDGIIQVNATDHLYSIDDIKLNNKTIYELSNQKKALILVVASEFSDMGSDARQFATQEEAMSIVIAKAYVIKSLAQRLLANFAIKVNGFSAPVKFFNAVEPAIEWLNSNKNNYHS